MPESGLGTLTVVEDLDVLEQDGSELRSRFEVDRTVDPGDLSPQRCPEGLHRGVAIHITGRSIAREDPEVFQMLREGQGGVGRSLVVVMQQRACRNCVVRLPSPSRR
jgi:hypothetical protein